MRAALGVAVASVFAAACAGSGHPSASGGATKPAAAVRKGVPVRLGYFPNVTHAPAIVGIEGGILARALAPDQLRPQSFNAGPAAVEALLSGAIDASFIGPNPAINAFVRSNGKAIRIVAGATSGGAALVVRPGIGSAADLRGRKLATPQLGNTQDVALRFWLREHGLRSDPQGGGDVSILPQENAQTLATFRAGSIDGAWVPEPWAARLVLEGGGKVLVDERDLWPGRRFATTLLVVRTDFLRNHPETVRRLISGHLAALRFLAEKPGESRELVNRGIQKVTGKSLAPAVIEAAWERLDFTDDPIESSIRAMAEHARVVGLLPAVDLAGLVDLRFRNEVRSANGASKT